QRPCLRRIMARTMRNTRGVGYTAAASAIAQYGTIHASYGVPRSHGSSSITALGPNGRTAVPPGGMVTITVRAIPGTATLSVADVATRAKPTNSHCTLPTRCSVAYVDPGAM